MTGMRWDIPAYGTATSFTFPLVDHFSPEQLDNVLIVQENWAVEDGEVAGDMLSFAEAAIDTPEGSVVADTGIRTPSVAGATVHLTHWAPEQTEGDTSAQAMADALTNGIPEDGGDATPWVTDAKGPTRLGSPLRTTSPAAHQMFLCSSVPVPTTSWGSTYPGPRADRVGPGN